MPASSWAISCGYPHEWPSCRSKLPNEQAITRTPRSALIRRAARVRVGTSEPSGRSGVKSGASCCESAMADAPVSAIRSLSRPRPVVPAPIAVTASYTGFIHGSLRSAPIRSPPVSSAVTVEVRPRRWSGTDGPIVTPRRPAADSGTPSSQRPIHPESRALSEVPAIQVAVEVKWLRSLAVCPTPRTTATLPASHRLLSFVRPGLNPSPSASGSAPDDREAAAEGLVAAVVGVPGHGSDGAQPVVAAAQLEEHEDAVLGADGRGGRGHVAHPRRQQRDGSTRGDGAAEEGAPADLAGDGVGGRAEPGLDLVGTRGRPCRFGGSSGHLEVGGEHAEGHEVRRPRPTSGGPAARRRRRPRARPGSPAMGRRCRTGRGPGVTAVAGESEP